MTVEDRPTSEHAVRIARDHCLAPERVDAPIHGGRYRSMFRELPPLEADETALHALGRPGGPCDLGKDDPPKLLLSAEGSDVPRNREGIALIGDPRNDVHLFTSQMAVAFIKLHNRLVDRLREDETAEDALFEQARRAATWHYQHVIVREFLPSLIGAELTTELLDRSTEDARRWSSPCSRRPNTTGASTASSDEADRRCARSGDRSPPPTT